MIYTKDNLIKRGRILFIIFIFSVNLHAQTIVQIMVDQPEKFEVVVADMLFKQTDNTITFGTSVNLTGGEGPYKYSWLKEDKVIGTTAILELQAPLLPGLYSLLVTDANNCSAKLVSTYTHLQNEVFSRVSVYPIPASRSVTIDPEGEDGILDVAFYNSKGNLMLQKQISGKTQVSIDFPSGIYFLNIENDSRELIGWKKIIVL